MSTNPFQLHSLQAKLLASSAVAAVFLWFVTCCVNAVNFDAAKKQDASGNMTNDWGVTIFMLVISSLAFTAVLACAAVSVYYTVGKPGAIKPEQTSAVGATTD